MMSMFNKLFTGALNYSAVYGGLSVHKKTNKCVVLLREHMGGVCEQSVTYRGLHTHTHTHTTHTHTHTHTRSYTET